MNIIERIKSRTFWINLGLFVLAVFILIFLLSFFLRIYTDHGQSLTVPDFRKRTMEEVIKLCDENHLRYEIKDSVFEPDKAPLTVLDQNPKAGAKVKQNRRIYLILNAGKAPMVAMPNIIDEQRRQAERVLQSNGLIPGTHPEYKPNIGLNLVLEAKVNGHDIPAGTKIEKGSIVEFVLGDGGRGGTSVTVRNLVGKSYEDAKFAVISDNVLLGHVDSTGVNNMHTAIIYKQNPLPGKKISMGDVINVWLKDK